MPRYNVHMHAWNVGNTVEWKDQALRNNVDEVKKKEDI